MTHVWVCIATYGPDDDVEPLVAVAITAQAADEQIYNVIHEYCKGTNMDEDEWIVGESKEHKVLK